MEDFKPLIKSTKFKYLWASQVLSQLTIHIMNFLLLIRLFSRTGSAIATSFLWVSYALPAIIIGPFAAVSVDMVDRRKMLMVTNLLQSATIFLYSLLHEESLFLLYGIVIAYSFLNQFYVPAEAASLPALVKKKSLPQANGLFLLTQQAALILGFGVAGGMNQWLGFRISLFVCAALLFIAFMYVSLLPEMKTEEKIPREIEKALLKFFERIFEGYRFIKGNQKILLPFLLLMGLQVSLVVVVVNVPVLASELLNIDINSAGILIVVPAGIGAVLGTFLVSRMLKQGWRKKRVIESFLMSILLLLFLLTFVVPEVPLSVRGLLSFAIIVLLGVSFVGIFIPSQTYLQEATPGGLRGRVFGNYWFLVTVATIFPVVFSGAVTEVFGIRLLLFLLGCAFLSALFFSKKYGQKVINNNFPFVKR